MATATNDASLIDLTSPPQESKPARDSGFRTELDIFDLLCLTTNDSQYGNVKLPSPLLNNAEPDPFDVNARFCLFNRVNWGMPEGTVSDYKSDSDVIRSLNFPTTSVPSSVSSISQLDLNLSVSHRPLCSVSTDSDQVGQRVDISSLNFQDFHGSSYLSKGVDTSAPRKIFENTENTQTDAEGLLYCEPPVDDVQYLSQPVTRSPGSFDNQSISRLSTEQIQSIRLQSVSGLDSSFKEHLARVLSSPTGSGSLNVPLKLPPPPRFPSQSRNPFYQSQTVLHSVLKPAAKSSHQESLTQFDIDRAKTDKAFDWLNDALKNNLSGVQQSQSKVVADMNKKSPCQAPSSILNSVPLYDSVPDEKVGYDEKNCQLAAINQSGGLVTDDKTHVPVGYPNCEGKYSPGLNHYSNTQQGIYANSSVLADPSTLNTESHLCASNTECYAYSSTFSDCTWDDDFDDDDFSESSVNGMNVQDVRVTSSAPPPLPPRTYLNKANNIRVKTSPEKPYILPQKRDGQQLSHTHYFLIPPINQLDPPPRCTEKSPQKRTMAAVKPYVVNSAFDIQDENNSHKVYENVSDLLSQDIVARSLSSNSTLSRSSTGSGGSESSSPKLHHHHQFSSYRSAGSSPTRPQPIEPQRKSAVEQEECTFMSSSPRDRIDMVQNQVIGVTDDECYAALSTTHWDVDSAVKYLKVEQLFRLGVAPRTSCQRLLETLNWNLELASSVIIDEVQKTKARCESAV